MRRWPAFAVLWLLVAAAGWGLLAIDRRPPAVPDAALANDLVQTAIEQWPPTRADFPPATPDFTVVDASGHLVVAQGTPITSDLAAQRAGVAAFTLVKGQTRLGSLYLDDGRAQASDARARRAVRLALWTVLGFGLLATAWLWWIDRRVLRPFRDLRGFATQIAKGRLDTALGVRRSGAFGAFTQAFDLLRTELARSHDREAEAQQARKTLVAQLSHDIRTPLAGITSATEVLLLSNDDPRLQTILDKARQIDGLTTDLFRANADEAVAIELHLTALPSSDIGDLVRDADAAGWLTTCDIEPLMVVADRQRLQQVVDNIVANAAKYGAAPLEVTSRASGDMLSVTIRDHGAGVPEEELPLIVQRHYRASNAAGRPGQGLGLHTAASLLERMGGSLDLANAPGGGLAATITLACAERPADPRRHAFG